VQYVLHYLMSVFYWESEREKSLCKRKMVFGLSFVRVSLRVFGGDGKSKPRKKGYGAHAEKRENQSEDKNRKKGRREFRRVLPPLQGAALRKGLHYGRAERNSRRYHDRQKSLRELFHLHFKLPLRSGFAVAGRSGAKMRIVH